MTTPYEAVIGLEVHAQLRTKSKIFCRCSAEFARPLPSVGSEPNARTCPVCLGLPGALPVLNDEVVRMAILAGLATHCDIQERSVFARKNYFYPDLPKGYQISQADEPLCVAGYLDIETEAGHKRCGIQRIHIEEDAGKSIHGEGDAHTTTINLDRAGVPLIEIVGLPDLRTPDEAVAYLRELRAILVSLGVNDGNMDEGSLRCDANVSVRPVGEVRLGTRCEIKNMNSFRSVRDAVTFEIARQVDLARTGERIEQQTRLWNQDLARTEAMRSKEHAHDYRYFPDPDLPPLVLAPGRVERLRASLPELPAQKRTRWQQDLGLTATLAAALCEDPQRAQAFEATLGPQPDPKRAAGFAHFLMGQVAAAQNRSQTSWSQVEPALPTLLEVCDRWRSGDLTNQMLTQVLTAAFAGDGELQPNLEQALSQVGTVVSDAGALEAQVDAVLEANAAQVQKYRAGQQQLFGFFVGQVMKSLQGKGNAQLVGEILRRKLAS